jgi:spore photoproduct lyase
VAREEEPSAPSVESRLAAAKRVVERGFSVGFHFDPLLRYPGWEEDYRAVLSRLLASIPAARIRWISLGALRFHPSLKLVIQKRFPATRAIYDEFIPGRDGKLRYFRPIRLELYRKISAWISEFGGERIPLYLCMESREMWEEVWGKKRGKKSFRTLFSPLRD